MYIYTAITTTTTNNNKTTYYCCYPPRPRARGRATWLRTNRVDTNGAAANK